LNFNDDHTISKRPIYVTFDGNLNDPSGYRR